MCFVEDKSSFKVAAHYFPIKIITGATLDE